MTLRYFRFIGVTYIYTASDVQCSEYDECLNVKSFLVFEQVQLFRAQPSVLPNFSFVLPPTFLSALPSLSDWREMPQTDVPRTLMPWPKYEERPSFSKVLKPKGRQ